MKNQLYKKRSVRTFLFIFILSFIGCKDDLIKVNINPNDATPETTNPNLVLSTVLTDAGKAYVDLGFGDLMGTMQYTKKDAHATSYNQYHWNDKFEWSPYYNILRNDRFVFKKAVEQNNELLEGVARVMRAMVFGTLTNMYGDIPYEQALKGDLGGEDHSFPPFSSQKDVFMGVLADLDTANTILSKPPTDYDEDISAVDVFYHGDPRKWRKLANSLALRFYWRLSEKLPDVARQGIEKIASNPDEYPLILDSKEDATMSFPGNSSADSWPNAVAFNADSSDYRRVKMGNTLVTKLLELQDPRIAVWAQRVQIFLHVDDNLRGVDEIRDTVVEGEPRKYRLLSPDKVQGLIDQNVNYVGIRVTNGIPQAYNMSPEAGVQAPHNPHVSWLAPMYMQASGPLLLCRMMAASEVHFILAEAKATKGWTQVDAEKEYYAGIKASFETWNTSENHLLSKYDDYIGHPEVQYNGTQKQIVIQKWISCWTTALQSWLDYRRTGYPQIHGVAGVTRAPVVPIRMDYPAEARNTNGPNEKEAEKSLKATQYSALGSFTKANSPWSRMWLLQTGNEDIPWKR